MKKKTMKRILAFVFASALICMPFSSIKTQAKGLSILGDTEFSAISMNVGANDTTPYLEYSVHIQDLGDLPAVTTGMTGGNGQGLRAEQVKVNLKNAPQDSYVAISVHLQDIGWTSYSTKNNQAVGTTGQSKQIEAIQAELKGSIAKEYNLYYRVHCTELGDLSWVASGQKAGSEGCNVAVEAVEFKLVSKSQKGPSTSNTGGYFTMPKLTAIAHIQNIGDVKYTANSDGILTIGSTGKSQAIEGLDVNLTDILSSNQAIKQRLHLTGTGWESSFTSGFSGTRGQSKRAEAAEFQLSGNVAKLFDVVVQGHVENIGWQDWTKNSCGTTGKSLRLESIRIKLVRKTRTTGISSSGVISENATVTSNSNMVYPIDGATCSWRSYGANTWSFSENAGISSKGSRNFHLGLDLVGSNSTIRAFAEGDIVASSNSNAGANGRYVIVKHTISNKTIYSFYAHLLSVTKTSGHVSTGEEIGKIGGSGYSSNTYYGTHLHFAIVDTLWSNGGYYGYSTAFSGNQTTYGGVTYYNPKYVIDNKKLP